jgi:hypothetical protein
MKRITAFMESVLAQQNLLQKKMTASQVETTEAIKQTKLFNQLTVKLKSAHLDLEYKRWTVALMLIRQFVKAGHHDNVAKVVELVRKYVQDLDTSKDTDACTRKLVNSFKKLPHQEAISIDFDEVNVVLTPKAEKSNSERVFPPRKSFGSSAAEVGGCPVCGKTGHTADNCWTKHPDKRPK